MFNIIKRKISSSHVSKNISARVFSFMINLFNQLLLIPFYLNYWGVSKYADWVIISTVIGFVILSDFGFNEVISNRFIIEFQKNNNSFCNKLITNNYILLFFLGVISVIVFLITLWGDFLPHIFQLRTVINKELYIILFLLIIQVIIYQYSTVLNAVYKANEKAYRAFFLDDFSRLLELLILIMSVILGLSFVTICVLLIIPKLMVWFFKIYDTEKYFKLKFSFSDFDLSLLRQFVKPSFAFMAFPIGYVILNQGFTLLVNSKFNAEVLVMFNTSRTLVNMIKSITGILLVSVWPAISIAYGKSDFDKLRQLNKLVIQFGVFLVIIITPVILFFGELIFSYWVPSVIYDLKVVLLLLVSFFFGNLWYTSSLALMATNKHNRISFYFFCLSILSISIGFILKSFTDSIYYIISTILIVDIPLAFLVLLQNLSLLNESLINLFKFNFNVIYSKNKR